MNHAARIARLTDLVRQVEEDPPQFGVLSSGEQVIVAAVLDRVDLLKRAGCGTLAAAKDRLGEDWMRAVKAEKSGRT